MLVAFIFVVWIAGGSARADALGQVVVRLVAWGMIICQILIVTKRDWVSIRPIALLLAATIGLLAIQLIPLPPSLWMALPAGDTLRQSAEAAGLPQPWRPLSISPGGTINALGSLVVPIAALGLVSALSRSQHQGISTVLLVAVVGGCILGLLQLSGARFDNPLINEMRGLVSGNLANRNHFALFVSIGIVLTIYWAAHDFSRARSKLPLAFILLPFFLMILFVTGSRSGLILGVIATIGGLLVVKDDVVKAARGLTPRLVLVLGSVFAGALALAALIAIRFGQAEAVDRLSLDAGGDMRVEALPVLSRMVAEYFPWGSGFGTFDPAFRISEPDSMLRTVYFNHAHNDWIEIAIEGGLAGIAIALMALLWFVRTSISVWSPGRRRQNTLARVGSVIIVLTIIASITDYPARTPLVMTILVLAAAWLAAGTVASHPSSKGGQGG